MNAKRKTKIHRLGEGLDGTKTACGISIDRVPTINVWNEQGDALWMRLLLTAREAVCGNCNRVNLDTIRLARENLWYKVIIN